MSRRLPSPPQFYGSTTLGQKGQIVVPAEAREAMKLQKGDKLLVFGEGEEMLMLAKLSNLERLASHLAGHLDAIRDVIRKTGGK